MTLKQFIGIPLLLLFVSILGKRLIDNLSQSGGTPMVLLAFLIILFLMMLAVKQLLD